ncbi:hypothetical protein BC6307_01095 [Sutcliffiella cohnii]|uniref:Major facilitator superfamily (MFS) profile domain-containing protein n=1 Tax=Sutcliffiella cohnii TaxID=33932 RepID=A0A223KKU1_9BACI|nr:MFS transporter [Sutcliffiella cohnii]AST89973.1 hypothetical protein BC6307_01095 [Sutcliffiella cohnii]
MTTNLRKEETIWQNSIFMRLFASYSVSMLGHWFDMVAIIVLFGYVWNADPMMIALIPVAYALPQVVLGQFAGVLSDKFHKVKIMMVADFTTALLTFILLFSNHPITAIIVISLRATVNVVHSPAQQGLVKLVVKENLIMKAITLNGSVNQLSKIIGPFIGASLVGIASPKLCILINAIAFTISAIILLTIIVNKEMVKKTTMIGQQNAETEKEHFWGSWKKGWVIVYQKKVLFVSLIACFLAFTAIQMIDFQFPVFFREIAPHLPQLAGWIMGSSGLGALVMILMLNRYKNLKQYGWLIGGSLVLIGGGFGGIGFLQEGFILAIPLALSFILGLGVGLLSITSQYIIQMETKQDEIGRVTGISNSVISFTVLISPIMGGVLIHHFGFIPVCLCVASFLVIIGISLFGGNNVLFKTRREEDEKAMSLTE